MKKRIILSLCCLVALGFINIKSVSAQKRVKAPELQQVRPREIKMDTDYDGIVDRLEVYDEKGTIVRVEADTTGDGKMNEWIYYKNGIPTKAEKDINGNGKPDTFLTYDKKGIVIIRSETDTNGDGKTDEWVYYEDGLATKAEKDADGDGKPDTWIAY